MRLGFSFAGNTSGPHSVAESKNAPVLVMWLLGGLLGFCVHSRGPGFRTWKSWRCLLALMKEEES